MVPFRLFYTSSMLKSQRNTLLRLINDLGIDKRWFYMTEDMELASTNAAEKAAWRHNYTIRVRNLDLFFMILYARSNNDKFALIGTSFAKKVKTKPRIPPNGGWTTFDDLTAHLKEWLLKEVVPFIEDQNEVDEWEKLNEDRLFNSPMDDIRDEPVKFTKPEVKELKASIQELEKKMIEQLALNTEQVKLLGERLTHLQEGAERMTKKDWKVFAYGIVWSLVQAFFLNSDAVQHLGVLWTEMMQRFNSRLIP